MKRRLLVLHLLREAGNRGVTTSEFLQGGCGSRFGGRIFELRQGGHVIECDPVRQGEHRYTLTRDAERDIPAPIGAVGRDVSPGAAPAPSGAEQQPGEGDAPPSTSPDTAAAPLTPLFDPPRAGPRPGIYDYDPEEGQAA